MATLIEAFDNTMKEAYAGIKLFLWAIPICFAIAAGNIFGYVVWAVVGFLLLGFVTTLSNNVIAKSPYIVPGINIFALIANGLLALIAMLPTLAVMVAIIMGSSYLQIPNEVWNDTLHVFLYFVAISFPATSLAIFIRRKNILETLNIKKFFFGYGEIFLSLSVFFIKMTCVTGILIAFLAYIFYLFIGFDNLVWTYLVSVVNAFVMFIGGNYLAQISDEVYTFPEKEEAKKREQKAIEALTEKKE